MLASLFVKQCMMLLCSQNILLFSSSEILCLLPGNEIYSY